MNKEFKRMQKLAGLLKENEDNRGEDIIQQYIQNGSKGDLDLSESSITSLPDNLTVDGNLDLNESSIKSLPHNLKVNGWLNLNFTEISSIPEDLIIRSDLHLQGTMLRLPDNLEVDDLDLREAYIINKPPYTITVRGELYLGGSNIEVSSLKELKQMFPNVEEFGDYEGDEDED